MTMTLAARPQAKLLAHRLERVLLSLVSRERPADAGGMPLLNVYTSAQPLPEARATELLKQLSASLAENLRKPESYVMTCMVPRTQMTFAGSVEPCCYVEVKAIGAISTSAAKAVSAAVTERLTHALGVPADRVFIVFSEVDGRLWGHGGNTFG